MEQVYVKYNPYKLETVITVNGNSISTDSTLSKIMKGKRLQEWIGIFPQMLIEEFNTVDFDITFKGMALDWDDFADVFKKAKLDGTIKQLDLKFVEAQSDESINDRIVKVFSDLKEGPIEDFRDPKLIKAFSNINNAVFPINVIATMSSGKSTLINALLGKKLMPSKNEACTATITEILDNDQEQFAAVVYDNDDVILQEVSDLTYDIMNKLNADDNVYRIAAQGNIPFLDAQSTALMLVDTPGPNNSQNQAHKNTTYRAINNDANNLILYVLNGTQLSTNDDAALLSYVAEQIKKGGKQVRDRFLFVVNKMDGFNPEEEDVENAILAAKKYLASYGIEDPQIFPCSAYTALNLRTYFRDIVNIDNLTRKEEKELPSAARDTLPMIDKFIEYESMHMEKYSTLSPSAQQELDYRLSQAEKNHDTKELALIHCGIYSIEAAIKAYVKKYAKTKKVKDLVESFQEVLESTQILAKAKTLVATNEEAARACAARAEAIHAKIANGEEAQLFKNRIAELNPMISIQEKAEKLKEETTTEVSKVFTPYGDTINNRELAKGLVAHFTSRSSDSIAKLTSELESIINQEVIEAGENILKEYQEKLVRIDEGVSDKQLDFATADLIKGSLKSMRDDIGTWCSEEFATDTIEEVGDIKHEEKVYYEKVGQKEEKVADGTEKVKVGTKKVAVGKHKEKVGSHKVEVAPRGFFGKIKHFFGKREYTYVDDYEEVIDYKDEDVYETRIKYKKVMRDIYEERRETIEKFSVETGVLQTGLLSRLRKNLNDGIEDALCYAEDQIGEMKRQFTEIFDELDELIEQKYEELEQCSSDQKTKEEELKKNQKLLAWINANKAEIDDILNI